MFTGLFILFIEATTTTSPLVTPPPLSSPLFRRPRAARRASPRTLRIARNFTYRSELYASLYASLLYYFTARYFTHDQCGEWKYSDIRGEISYFTHELYAQNCIKIISPNIHHIYFKLIINFYTILYFIHFAIHI